MSTTLFVGNLKWECSDAELVSLFSGGGFVPSTATVVMGRNGRSRGYGLVTFNDADTATSAASAFNEQEFQTRNLIVHIDKGATTKENTDSENKPKPAKKVKAPRAPKEASTEVSPNFTGTSLFVNNLSWATTSEELSAAFAEFSAATASVATRNDGRSRGWGTVQFKTVEECNKACSEGKGMEVGGRVIEVGIDSKA